MANNVKLSNTPLEDINLKLMYDVRLSGVVSSLFETYPDSEHIPENIFVLF